MKKKKAKSSKRTSEESPEGLTGVHRPQPYSGDLASAYSAVSSKEQITGIVPGELQGSEVQTPREHAERLGYIDPPITEGLHVEPRQWPPIHDCSQCHLQPMDTSKMTRTTTEDDPDLPRALYHLETQLCADCVEMASMCKTGQYTHHHNKALLDLSGSIEMMNTNLGNFLTSMLKIMDRFELALGLHKSDQTEKKFRSHELKDRLLFYGRIGGYVLAGGIATFLGTSLF